MRRARSLLVASLLMGGSGLAGCATAGAPPLGEPGKKVGDQQAETRYQTTLKKFSDHREQYANFETDSFLGATYQSLEFREARVRREAAFLELPEASVQTRLAEERQAFDTSVEFTLGLHVNNYHFDDLDRRDSHWRIALVTGDGEVLPSLVERVGRADVNVRTFYPYMSDFWTVYRVRFPKAFPNGQPVLTGGAQTLALRMASVLTRADLKVPAE